MVRVGGKAALWTLAEVIAILVIANNLKPNNAVLNRGRIARLSNLPGVAGAGDFDVGPCG